MEKSKSMAIFGQFESMKKQANELLQQLSDIDRTRFQISSSFLEFTSSLKLDSIMNDINSETNILLEAYNSSIPDVKKTLGIKVSPIDKGRIAKARLRQLILECDKVIGLLKSIQTSLSTEEIDKMNHIRTEISKICEDLDINFEKNLNMAVTESENGHFLASAIITSRIVEYVLDKIEGKNIEDKIDFLVSKGLIDKDRKDVKEAVIKASKLSRNFFSHRIDTFVESSEALTLLGDCVKILRIYKGLK